ncbi:MAG: hypothetical protein FWC43_02900 [Planctomycetaceae bacterium]|nr:hypothetical protein [Planctomycetaceae bacterium]
MSNRTTKIKSFQKFLKKRYKHVPQTQSRKVLEHLIYAACLENATFEQADAAFSVLEHHYIDWNEIRVSTANELAYTFPHLPDAVTAGERIRKSLQAVFDTTYVFDLEELRKKNLSQAVEFLKSLGVCSRFMVDYTAHNAFGGHVIPLDESALRVFRLLGLAQTNKDNTREDVGGLERAISKPEGHEFANLLHHFAVEFYHADGPAELQQLLKPIDPQAVNRDWTAPVLVVTKPVKPQKLKPIIPPVAVAAVLDDDLDVAEGVRDVEEVEFLPNPITGEETPFEVGDDDEDDVPAKSQPAPKATPKTTKTKPVKKDAALKAGAKKPDMKKAKPKPPEKPSKNAKKAAPVKSQEKKGKNVPLPKKAAKKTASSPPVKSKTSAVKKDVKKTPKPPQKSPTKALRQKKPK